MMRRRMTLSCMAVGALAALRCAGAADLTSAFPPGNPPSRQCHAEETFPDGTRWETDCVFHIIPPRASPFAPKGMVRVLDPDGKDHLLSISFFPPAGIQVGRPYALDVAREGSFLSGLVQPFPGKQRCQMNRLNPAQGTVTFTAVGSTSTEYHGRMEFAPNCTIHQATPEERIVAGSEVGGGRTIVVF